MDTSNLDYSPHQLLPAPEPCTVSPPEGQFYHSVAKHLIRDTVRLMNNGLSIDLDKVEELEAVLDEQLATVATELASNLYIGEYLKRDNSKQLKAYIADRKSKCRDVSYYLKPFKHSDMHHRSYFMHLFAQQQSISEPSDLLPTGIPKWPANTVRKLAKQLPVLSRLLDGTLTSHPLLDASMQLLAQHKANIYNSKFLAQIESPDVPYPVFNPASSLQKRELFSMLGIESESTSKTTGEPSFNRDEIERIHRETTDEHIKHLTQCFIDHSFAAIVRNNFIEAFYKYTVDGKLYGNLKLFGTKTFRLTSNQPNLLNMPSTGSVFAKPVKQCLIAQPGFLVATADFSALENRVIANLAKEETLIKLYQDDLDGHCVNSLYYFREEIAQHITLTGDLTTDAKTYAAAVEAGNKELKTIRQRGKPCSFGLQYGAYPPKIAKGIKCSIEEAETIFNRYHNELYPAVTAFRETYVEPTAKETGKLHIGLGCYIHTDNPDRDIRTITNSCSQFWSILTLLTINKLHQEIDRAGMENDVIITSTIYDSIYFEVRNDPETVKWLNDTLIPIMTAPYLENEVVHNLADLEVGHNWADLHLLPNNASLEEVSNLLSSI
jgi:hypothetical protein